MPGCREAGSSRGSQEVTLVYSNLVAPLSARVQNSGGGAHLE